MSTGAAIPIGEVIPFCGSVRKVGVVSSGVVLEPIARVAVPEAVLPAGSDTMKPNVELRLAPFMTGLKRSPVNCATVNVSPSVTGVMPSANNTTPSVGNAFTVTVKAGLG